MYSASQKSKAAFDGAFDGLAWADRVSRHYSDQGTRLDIARDVPAYEAGTHIYVVRTRCLYERHFRPCPLYWLPGGGAAC